MDPVNNDVKGAVLGKLFVYFLGVFMPDIYICVHACFENAERYYRWNQRLRRLWP